MPLTSDSGFCILCSCLSKTVAGREIPMTRLFALQSGKPAQGSAATMKLWSNLSGLNSPEHQGYCPSFRTLVAAPGERRNDRHHATTFSQANTELLGVLPL